MIWPLVEYILFFVFLINFKCWALQSICYGIVSIFYQYVKLQIDMSQTLEEKKKKELCIWNSRQCYMYFLRIILNIWVFNILLCLVQVARFWYRRASGVAFVRRRQKLSVWWTEPFPTSSKMDLPLAKAEHISDRDRISVIRHLRRVKQHCKTERTENMWEKQLWQHQGRRSGEEVLKELEKSFSPEPMMKTVVTHGDLLQLMEVHNGIDIHTVVCGSLHARAALKERCSRGSLCWSKTLRGPVAHGERHPCRNIFSLRTCNPMGYPHMSIPFLKDCIPWKIPMLYHEERQSVERTLVGSHEWLYSVGGIPSWSREKVWGGRSVRDQSDHTLIPHLTTLLRWKMIYRKALSEGVSGKKRDVGLRSF